VYINALCDDNLKGLIVEGHPSDEELKMALLEITAEYSSLCGGTHAPAVNNSIRKIHLYRLTVISCRISIGLVASGNYSCLALLRHFAGINAKVPVSEKDRQKLLRQIDAKARGKMVQLKEELFYFEKLSRAAAGDKITARNYSEQIAAVSRFVGFHVNKMTILLSDYAAYVNQFNQSISNGLNK
jgi:hypothetical protein